MSKLEQIQKQIEQVLRNSECLTEFIENSWNYLVAEVTLTGKHNEDEIFPEEITGLGLEYWNEHCTSYF